MTIYKINHSENIIFNLYTTEVDITINNRERIQARIARDKAKKLEKRKLKAEKYNVDNIFKMQNFVDALNKCNKSVMWKGSVQKYNRYAIQNMYTTVKVIENGELPKLVNTNRISLYERGKERIIVPITIEDRIIQRVLCDNAIVPSAKDNLIYDNGASTKDKGIDFARRRMYSHLKSAIQEYGTDFYILTFDFKSFFDSIPHSSCRYVLDKYISNNGLNDIIMKIIKSYYKNGEDVGICLGSQISQMMALIVPNDLDHYIKDKMSVKHYIRYMDDGVIISDDKEFLKELYAGMCEIVEKLGLKFNTKKTHIVKASRGFKFLKTKYNITKDGNIIRRPVRKGIVRMRRKIKKFINFIKNGVRTIEEMYASFQSWLSHLKYVKHRKTLQSMCKYINRLMGYRLVNMRGGLINVL